MNLEQLNRLSVEEATHTFMQCCTASSWVEAMVLARPFIDEQALAYQADLAWAGSIEADYIEAFEGHPQIGNVDTLRKKYANTKELASGEQSSVNHASEQVLLDLAQGNSDYLDKFGFIFIVCATGKSAEQMLALLLARLPNNKITELANAAQEQRKIFHLRLNKLI
ncbi:2-oxo-4-hydroxy-4-carboxy-5-ureidoimidazoline decarboxylase [Shewanella psychropiezotolerans]|uniref:2-oxo-4-hydroxy-4-carboxy-5-ureidoimidazoline decarboxylase n=1 Tax=Shewanella psychropiezotolerans TaxID=2593655 RepID=A0ABX5WZ04_9GAMM|nr:MULTISPECIES: 2-oxo-4-hydroxy-4-carboxy-5-ureidoimidazoline decarboxylase [Shewanella]MPY24073.1 2-oxo-4-hydroxy-4-carboxy-5-ureidoimidazoline decarboxylase [Shewanella sp. YLB-07]QDO84334.1 2-oxo-4-hydroxy-4-carboxy-5-ureidoimidazoline decarboxylase [Shewanella psychropiezotolerans]